MPAPGYSFLSPAPSLRACHLIPPDKNRITTNTITYQKPDQNSAIKISPRIVSVALTSDAKRIIRLTGEALIPLQVGLVHREHGAVGQPSI